MESPADHGQTSDQPPENRPTGGVEPTAPSVGSALAKWLLIYTAIRIGMLVVLAAVLYLVGLPLILALLFAVILALPLSWVLFGGVRRRVNEAMAASTAHRRAERERLRSALDGRDQL